MDEARTRTLLKALDRPVEPRPDFTEAVGADIDAWLGGATALTATGAGAGADRRWRWVAVASAAAVVLAAVLITNPPGDADSRLRTSGPASPAPGQPPAVPGPGEDTSPSTTTPAPAPAGREGGVAPTITSTVAPAPADVVGSYTSPSTTAPADGTSSAAVAGVRLAYIDGAGSGRYGTLHVRDLGSSVPGEVVAHDVAWPGWAPDGSSVVVETADDVRILRIDGSVVRTFGKGYFPSFSPDGTQLVFSRPCPDIAVCNTEVVVVGVDGSNLRSLGQGAYPSWVPGGKTVLVTDAGTVCDGVTFDPCHGPIAIVNADGTGRRTLKIRGSFARMSTTGLLAYGFGEPDNSELYVSNVEGSDARVVSSSGLDDLAPAWLPDGSGLVYQEGAHLVLVDTQGSGRRPLGRGWAPAVVGTR